MSDYQTFRARFRKLTDLLCLGLMALASPVIGYFLSVLYACFDTPLYMNIHKTHVGHEIWFCGVLAIPTLLALFPFRRRVWYCWMVWAGCVVVWAYVLLICRAIGFRAG